jgi:glycosyltransferase involved in cell wall biosynthesis
MTRIATLVKGYPRLSETFIAQEILGLEHRGVAQLVVSLRHPTDKHVHAVNKAIAADVLYLPEYLKDEPARVRAGRRWAEEQPTFPTLWKTFSADLKRDGTVNRWRRLGQACVLARELPDDVDWLHTHFLHTPASVARYASILTGLPWSFSAHAKDIWTTPKWELREKLRDAAWGATCTRANLDYLRSLAAEPGAVHLVYHGLDFDDLPKPRRSDAGATHLRVVSVGRGVEKKGYADLLRALAMLGDDIDWRFDQVGGGPLSARLKAQAERLGLSKNIAWHGARDRAFVFDILARADLFVLPSRITASGDRDGLPNVLMEAQAMGVPVLSTSVSAIPELVAHQKTGWLVPEKDPAALAKAIRILAGDAPLRRRLGEAGSRDVRSRFAAAPGLDRLAGLLRAGRRRIAAE